MSGPIQKLRHVFENLGLSQRFMLAGFVMIIVSLQSASIGLVAEMISARSAREPNYVFKEYLVHRNDRPGGGSA